MFHIILYIFNKYNKASLRQSLVVWYHSSVGGEASRMSIRNENKDFGTAVAGALQ